MRRFIVIGITLVGTVFGAACGSDGPCGPRPETSCAQSCCSDHLFGHVCTEDVWTCPEGMVDLATCQGDCRPPPPSQTLCVDRDAGTCLGCPAGEHCYSTFQCTDEGDGGVSCADVELDGGVPAGRIAPDDRCYPSCHFFGCPAGTSCASQSPSACAGDVVPRRDLCLPPA